MKKKKVFFIDPQSYNNLSVYDYSLQKNMTDYSVVYFHNMLYECDKHDHVDYRSIFSYSSKKGKLAKVLGYCRSMMSICMAMIKERPDIVHIQWLRLWCLDYLFACLVKLMGIKLVFTAHNVLPHNPKRGDKWKYKLYYRLASAIIVHTRCTRSELINDFGVDETKINVIPHGMLDYQVNSVDVKKRCEELRARHNIKAGDIVFTCLGYQYKYKGVEMIVDVWDNVTELNSNPNIHLLIVGKNRNVDPAVFERLKCYSNAFFLDEQLSNLDFDAYMLLSSVTLLPYITISQSGLMFSALNSNIPILVSNIGGLTDPLQYANVGWNIGAPTYENLKTALLDLVADSGKIDNIVSSKEEFDKIRDVYSWNKISSLTSALYRRLTDVGDC